MIIAQRLGITRQLNNVWFWNKRLNILPIMHDRRKSTSPTNERIAVTDDGSTIVCWHPEKPFPYEFSKPLPEELDTDTNSVLKVQNTSAIYDVFKPKNDEQKREELMKITSTSKHIWFPRGKKFYKKKPTPRDREYL